jgi:hypothetical protein
MPRALSIKRTVVPPQDRKKYLERMRQRKDYYKRANCTFVLFEEVGLQGAFVEFTEAADPDALAAAHAASPESVFNADRIYQQVELP